MRYSSGMTIPYSAQLLRTRSYRRYLCALAAPTEVREVWFALLAFQQEVAHISEVVSEEMVGFIRYAWWRDALEKKVAAGHPVLDVLVKAPLPTERLIAMVDAYEKAMADKQSLDEVFINATDAPMMELLAIASGIEPSPRHAVLGTAWGAMEAAALPTMDAEHRQQFCALSEAHLIQVGQEEKPFMPFVRTLHFTLQRLKRGKNPDSKVLLPLLLYLS